LPQVDVKELDSYQDPVQKKQFVGNAIYGIIEGSFGPYAGKITGMLLDENVVNFH
jgi:hypothetical protein